MTLEELKLKLNGLITLAEGHLKSGDLDKYNEVLPQIEETEKLIKAAVRLVEAKALAAPKKPDKPPVPLALAPDDGGPPKKEAKSAEELEAERLAQAVKSIRVLRYGDIDENKAVLARQVVGQDYQELVAAQEDAFGAYIRFGEVGCMKRSIDLKPLAHQVWHVDAMLDMLKLGVSIPEVKTTMIEGADVLGGYAVPPQRASQVLKRLRGLTAVRAAGALVITTASNQLEWLKVRAKVTGGSVSDVYPTGLRGAWGHETTSPGETHFEFALEKIPVEVYTFKVPLSVSVLEDATNIVPILMGIIADTMAMDEDIAFVTGDGANKPYGLLPAGLNDRSFTELNSGVADEIRIATTKRLRRKIASQYRRPGRCAWMWESATAEIIEAWQDGIGRFYLETVEAGEQFFRFPVQETEAMPSITDNTFPILFGDFSGYAIVERLGLSIVRFLDSNTGINKVEYQVRRRIGGNVIEDQKFAVIKCSA